MNKVDYENHKLDFRVLTGKDADDNLNAFFNYLVMLTNLDLKEYLKSIRLEVIDINKKV